MDDSLLVSLRRYRPREGRDSLEDYITEIFAWLLRNSREVADAFLDIVMARVPKADRIELPDADQEITWDTQAPYPGARLDMLAQWPGGALLFEHKVHAPLTAEQVNKYRDLAASEFPGRVARVIVVSANTGQHRPEAHGCLCWANVYKLLEQQHERLTDPTEQFHIASFLALLRHEGLHPAAPISHQAVAFYPVAWRFPEQLAAALTPLAHAEWPLSEHYEGRGPSTRWGRLGFELIPAGGPLHWMPGLFIGVILDGRDHLVHNRHTDRVMLNVILDFSVKVHDIYPRLPSYQKLVHQLQELTPGKGWSFYDHLEDRPANYHHPLYLETPLLDVLRGTTTMEEQREAIRRAVCDAIDLLQHDNALKALTDEVRHKARSLTET
ncbi:PD-(D/E)XK nuclease family protein [Modicisalibacter radicis]|uniref:PD-(D/E)XK nuclease family protein n=1 Tax=Halomonas sp. EAR18 TaxID=2518972 RepID=UPI001443CC79|nr:PD-(D/E)XK nuclease family protein [Halomonas sp. EAR18]